MGERIKGCAEVLLICVLSVVGGQEGVLVKHLHWCTAGVPVWMILCSSV